MLLNAGLVAALDFRQVLRISRLVGAHDAALHGARETFDAIFEGRAQQRAGVEFDVLVGLAREIERLAEGFFHVI